MADHEHNTTEDQKRGQELRDALAAYDAEQEQRDLVRAVLDVRDNKLGVRETIEKYPHLRGIIEGGREG